MSSTFDLYLLPGLGADRRVFDRMDMGRHAPHFLDWPSMAEGSTLKDYAVNLASQVDRTRPHILIGMSMGGMVAQELAGITDPERTIIISSWKGPQEMPPPIRLLRGTHPERSLSKAVLERMMPVVRWQMGMDGLEDAELLDALMAVHSIEQLKVQLNACLTWEGPDNPSKDLVHIHGDRDHLMPLRYIQGPVVIKGGGHFMVHTHAEAVSKLVLGALES